MTVFGTTLFSLTPDWRAGAGLPALLERVAVAGCGPAVEVIGHQAWRDFPAISAEDERDFRDAVDRWGLVPASLGVYADLLRRPGRAMTTDEAFEDLRPQVQTAARLGFPVVRAGLGMESGLLRRVAAECDRLGVVLTFEVQGVTPPDAPAVLEVVRLHEESGSACLGFTIDFSLTTPALPAAFGTALRRHGLPESSASAVREIWARELPLRERIGAALAEASGAPDQAAITSLIAGVFGRTGRWQPEDWGHLLPLVRHAHAKFWDPDVETVREPHGAWLNALHDAGYTGAVVSEWGGHELLDSVDADALSTTRAHLDLLRELATGRAAVTA
jgi:hypothetical protein